MGCDIHGSIEKRVNGKWVMVNRMDLKARSRNYDRFARLAGVRGDGPEPRGVPEDVSDSTLLHIDEWGTDGHSHSWLPLHEAARIFLETEYTGSLSDFIKEYPMDHYFDVSQFEQKCTCCGQPIPNGEYRLVFWFDN